jgi:trans-2,3-dihydro-3-hydroxyanthranilate isomerase
MRIIDVKSLRIDVMRSTFYLVDVFAEAKYAGNQLAVVRNARQLSGSQMQRIACEMHFSETTFILSDNEHNGGYDVRIFTPATELPFAGHPTLGTAYIIRHKVIQEPIGTINLNLKIGKIPVTFERDFEGSEMPWMHQMPPTFGKTFNMGDIASLLNLQPDDIDEDHPIQEVSTGMPFLIVPLKSLAAIKRCHVNRHAVRAKKTPMEILVFSPETYKKENNLNVRVFVDLVGIPEDPATGSANGCLAGYLARYRYFGGKPVNVRVEQGYEIGRPSLLHLRAEYKNRNLEVHVGGKVSLVAEGELE